MDTSPDIAATLRNSPVAEACFERLPPSPKAQYLAWIAEAKKPETRARRIAGLDERLMKE